MSNLYFLERMMGERMRELEGQAELRSRLGLHALRDRRSPGGFRRWVGTLLIRAGHRLQGADPDPRSVKWPVLMAGGEAGRCGLV